jgi:hypothetical protein
LKVEAGDSTLWRICFGRGYGLVVKTDYGTMTTMVHTYINMYLDTGRQIHTYIHMIMSCVMLHIFNNVIIEVQHDTMTHKHSQPNSPGLYPADRADKIYSPGIQQIPP